MWGAAVSPPEVGSPPKIRDTMAREGAVCLCLSFNHNFSPLALDLEREIQGRSRARLGYPGSQAEAALILPLPTADGRRQHGNMVKNGDDATRWHRMNL
jgi:hypothetical protein